MGTINIIESGKVVKHLNNVNSIQIKNNRLIIDDKVDYELDPCFYTYMFIKGNIQYLYTEYSAIIFGDVDKILKAANVYCDGVVAESKVHIRTGDMQITLGKEPAPGSINKIEALGDFKDLSIEQMFNCNELIGVRLDILGNINTLDSTESLSIQGNVGLIEHAYRVMSSI